MQLGQWSVYTIWVLFFYIFNINENLDEFSSAGIIRRIAYKSTWIGSTFFKMQSSKNNLLKPENYDAVVVSVDGQTDGFLASKLVSFF